jgi:uracil-DNA glycosylase family 4
MSTRELKILTSEIVQCRSCPRLVAHRENIGKVKRRAYLNHEYWAKPVPGFGDPHARVLLLGLAPGAHGSNRTGRMFTGDASGEFMYPILHETGFASQAKATALEDGLKLKDAYILSTVRCAPPDNKPTHEELATCTQWLDREMALLKNVKVVVALGRIAYCGYLDHLTRIGYSAPKSKFKFMHGAEFLMPNGTHLIASYHPSQQNTLTGRLTKAMFQSIFIRACELMQ